jgi:hypothetical protein
LKRILQFFDKIHWIRIEDKRELSFQIDPILKDNEQKGFLIEYLSQYSEISQRDGVYRLK